MTPEQLLPNQNQPTMKSAEEILKPYIFEKAGKVNVNDALQAMHEYAAQDRWVKVSERLPEKEDELITSVWVLAYLSTGENIFAYYDYETKSWPSAKGKQVTHWQYLTAPKD